MVLCLPCLAVPAAMIAASGATGAAVQTPEEKKKRRMYLIIYWISIGILAVSIFILIYFVFIKKTPCEACTMTY